MAKAAKKAPTKTEVLQSIANATDLTKKQVAAVLEALTDEVRKNLGSRGCGVFTLPGLVKIEKKKVPARPAQKNVMNPFTGELQDRPAKPAYNKVKVRALRNLKDMAEVALSSFRKRDYAVASRSSAAAPPATSLHCRKGVLRRRAACIFSDACIFS